VQWECLFSSPTAGAFIFRTMAKPKNDFGSTDNDYTVVARRYRPQQFAQLIGQESTSEALINALKSGRVAHAYLFTGARGVGKTSCARILAKALNCEQGPTATPCDQCEICLSIATGDDVDVLEIDGASNRGIDEIREIRQNVQFRPSRARYKIYIIDEVHMLTAPAFNALLKTLEEPPAGVKFIFATTEVNKLPVTILSRCQRFDFGLIQTSRIAEHLRAIVKQEKREADESALNLVARRAAGSMRDAESLLDQLMAFGERLTPDLVHRLLGTAPADRVLGLAKAVMAGDAQAALNLLEKTLQEGTQIGEIVDQLVECWRDLMMFASVGSDAPGMVNSPGDLQPLVANTSLDKILAGLDILTMAKSRLRSTNYGRVLVEMSLVRLTRLDQLLGLGELLQTVEHGGASTAPTQTPSANTRPTSADEEKKKSMNQSRLARPR